MMFTCCSCEEENPVVGRRDAGEIVAEDEDDDVADCGRLEGGVAFCWSVRWWVKSVEERLVLLLDEVELEERWVFVDGLGAVAGGFIVDELVFVLGLLVVVLLIILSTANGDAVILDAVGPVSTSLRKDPATDLSDGTFVANCCCCCCCCCLWWLTDDVDEGVDRWDADRSLLVDEVEDEWELTFNASFDCFLYWANRSIEKSITPEGVERFDNELRFADESEGCEDGETVAGLATGRITSDLFVLCTDCSFN